MHAFAACDDGAILIASKQASKQASKLLAAIGLFFVFLCFCVC